MQVPKTMARTTSDLLDADVEGTMYHSDTVITCSNGTSSDLDRIGLANMDAISVGT